MRQRRSFIDRATRATRRLILSSRDLFDDERGGSMIFGVITMLLLVCFIASVHNLSGVSSSMMDMQNAADAAAYSGALVAADNLNAVAQINDTMALVYYSLMRYNIDIIVFGVLNELAVHDEFVQQQFPEIVQKAEQNPSYVEGLPVNPPIPFVYGRPAAAYQTYFQELLQGHSKQIEAGQRWIEGLAEAERKIAEATPAMIRLTVFEVAKRNGATRVSIYPELKDDSFFGGDDSYLIPDRYPTDALFSQDFVRRYQERANHVERIAVEVPRSWYSELQGRSQPGGSGYYQVRVCWNAHDTFHGLQTGPGHSDPRLNVPFGNDRPNGHWHHKHKHLVLVDPMFPPVEVEHFGGHGDDPTDPTAGDPQIHLKALDRLINPLNFAHHAVVTCPTCRGYAHSESPEVSSVMVTERRTAPDFGNLDDDPSTVDMKVRELFYQRQQNNQDFDDLQPLLLNETFKDFAINVAVHQERRQPFISALFPSPAWGSIGIASAKVGLMVNQTSARDYQVDVLGDSGSWLEDIEDNPENLYLAGDASRGGSGGGNEETYFSARLVPIGLEENWGDVSPEQGLENLLTGQFWRKGPDDTQDAKGQAIGRALSKELRFGRSVLDVLDH